jgi:very-short-patch-repair endonuclease
MTRNTQTARRLRQRQTDAERLRWLRLRDRRVGGWKFRRQMPIDRFIVDFCCPDAKVVIEIDGGQHGERAEQDANRTTVLEAMGYIVVRFWNHDVIQNPEGVLEEIMGTLNQLNPDPLTPTLSPSGRGSAPEQVVGGSAPRRSNH